MSRLEVRARAGGTGQFAYALRMRAAALLAGALALALAACDSGPGVEELAHVTLATEGGSTPTVAIDPADGAALVAWVGTHEGEANVYLTRVAADSSASDPVRVNDIAGDAEPHDQAPAQIAIGPEGSVYVAWQNRRPMEWLEFGASAVRLARSVDGGETFEGAVTVTDSTGDAPARQTFHDLVVGPDGTVYVSWIDARERDRVRRDRFQRESIGAEASVASGAPPEPETDIRIARSEDGGQSFTPGLIVDTESCPCCRTALGAGLDGEIYVAWRKIFDGEVRDVAVARSEDGARTFARPVRPREEGWVFPGCPHAGPALTVDGRGTLHAAWYTGRRDAPGVYHAVSTDGGRSFQLPSDVMADEWVPASQVKLAASADSRVWIAWDDRREDEARVRLAAVDRAMSAGVVPRLRGSTLRPVFEATGVSPAVAAHTDRVALVWLDDEAVHIWIGRKR